MFNLKWNWFPSPKNMLQVNIGGTQVGQDKPIFVVAEIGINHNGDLNTAKKLIDAAAAAGCNAVKFQKRTVPVVYSETELQRPREVPSDIMVNAMRRGVLPQEAVERLVNSNFQDTTNGDLKWALELTLEEYQAIDKYCREKRILWLVSCWDEASVDFIEQFNPPAYKIASASLADDDLLRYIKSRGRAIILSTGMSTQEQVDHAVGILGRENLVLMHTVSTYPAETSDLNLYLIQTLQERYNVPAGYSGHEVGLFPSLCAVSLGACMVERHITLNRAMWGTDQAASVEPKGIEKLVKEIRIFEKAKGDGEKRLLESEVPIMQKLRRKTSPLSGQEGVVPFPAGLTQQLNEARLALKSLNPHQEAEINNIGQVLIKALKSGNKILTCGNGGSANDAEHFVEELVGRFRNDRVALPAIALTVNSGLLTCITNDYSFDDLFARQVQALGSAGDVLVGFSTSGNSVNVCRAFEEGRKKGLISVGLLGKDGGQAKEKADYKVVVASSNTARIQEVHTFLFHYFCDVIELVFVKPAGNGLSAAAG